jgi:spore coat protein U-like protein
MKRALAVVAAALTLASLPAALEAGTGTVSFQAKAVVNAKCTIGKSGDLSFGTYDPLAAGVTSGSTSLDVSCTRNTGASISITTGSSFNSGLSSFNAALANRRSMKRSGQAGAAVDGDLLAYDLWQPTAAGGAATKSTTLWGDGTSITTVLAFAGAATKLVTTYTIFGEIPGLQDVTPDPLFVDNVVATISF